MEVTRSPMATVVAEKKKRRNAVSDLGIVIGEVVRFAKTVGETDVYLFAGITGDFAPNHVDEQAMRATSFGGRIAHGALLVGYMSTFSTMMARKAEAAGCRGGALSVGFDRIRLLKPVRLGDTVTRLRGR